VRDRHLAWAVGLAEAAEPALLGREQIAWLDRLEAEHDNIRAALRWAGERGDAAAALRLTGNLWHFWDVRGHYVEARANYDAALALPGAEAPTAARALALVGAGYMMAYVGESAAAEPRLHEAAALAERVGEPRIAVLALGLLSRMAVGQGDYATGQRQARAALERARAIGDAWAEAMSLRNLTKNAGRQGDHAALRAWIEQRRPLVRRIGQPWLEHNLHCDLAELAGLEGNRAAKRAHLDDALALSRALATPNSIAGCLLSLVAIALDEGDVAAARRHGVEGLRMMRDLGLGSGSALADGLEVVAGLAAATGQPARALRFAGAAAASRAALGTRPSARNLDGADRWLAPARQALSEAEQAAAWAGGAALTLDEAVAEALAGEGDGPPAGIDAALADGRR
jgi:non-specific serine/threonine protein kinase